MTEVNFLEMSDEDLLKHAIPVATETPAQEPVAQEPAEPAQVEDTAQEPAVVAEAQEDEQEELSEEEQAAAAALLDPEDGLGDAAKAAEQAKPKAEKAEPVKDAATDAVTDKPAAAEAATWTPDDFMAEVLKPFKANGREMSVTSPEEVRTLMQQGANYNKKMQGLKPHLALVKQLEQNNLLSDEKIGFLIDLSKKNPEAIGKLLKDSGIDPLDLDSDKVAGYKPNTYTISDEQLNLDSVLDDLKDDEHFKPVIHAVANEWDVTSQKAVAAEPNVLRVLAKHKELGVYDTITTEVERRKALGQLNGVPALQAYKLVGDEFEAAGKFANLVSAKPATSLPVKKTVAAKPAKPAESQAVIDKRKAAASTASAPAIKPGIDPDFNPLAMSDEEFAKIKLPL